MGTVRIGIGNRFGDIINGLYGKAHCDANVSIKGFSPCDSGMMDGSCILVGIGGLELGTVDGGHRGGVLDKGNDSIAIGGDCCSF